MRKLSSYLVIPNSNSPIFRAIKLLSRSDRRKFVLLIFIQAFSSVLDLIGVALIGVISALTISGFQAKQPGTKILKLLDFLNLQNISIQSQAAILAVIAATILISKTLFSIYVTKRTVYFLSLRGAQLSSELISKLFSSPLLTVKSKSMNEMIYSLTGGIASVTVGVLSTGVGVIADLSILVIMGLGLAIVDPLIALGTVLLFGLIGLILYRFMHVRAKSLGMQQANISIETNEKILEVISAYREILVRNRREYYSRTIGSKRMELASIQAELAFMPNISTYTIEIALVIGAISLSAIQFLTQDATHAVATLTIFIAASSRIAPAVLRIQQGVVQIKSNLGSAAPTLELVESLSLAINIELTSDKVDVEHEGFIPEIEIKEVSFTYPGSKTPAINSVTLSIPRGAVIAFVGQSGAGKTTMVDILLGVLPQTSGMVTVSGLKPLEAIRKWPGAIAYVPQDVMISNTSIRGNVSMGFPLEEASDDLIWSALEIAQLSAFAETQPNSLNQLVGDRGSSISGGQRQRLGIARAMFTKPKLLVLDEATSSLDGQTEADISEAISRMRGEVTIILVAHRLSTVMNADLVVYMDKGSILSKGTFDEVRSDLPEFDKQATLMGL